MAKKRRRKTKREGKAERRSERLAKQQSQMLKQLFGYSKSLEDAQATFDSNTDHLVCMAKTVESRDVIELKQEFGVECKVDQWVVSTGRCGDIKIHGPFDTIDAAMAYGVEGLGVVSWRSPPAFFDLS